MNFNTLKKYECPELTIIEKFHYEEKHEQLQWSRLLSKEMTEFRLDFSDQRLKNNEIIVPIFTDDLLLPLSYTSESKSGSTVYTTYANYIFYQIEYKRAHLVKIRHHFGIRTFNQNDEKYLKPIILDTVEYYFQFDFDKKVWKWAQHEKNIEIWYKEKEIIDQLFQSNHTLHTTKQYYIMRKQLKSLQLENFNTYIELFASLIEILESTKNFIEMRKLLGDIDIFPFSQIMSSLNQSKKTLDSIQSDVQDNKLILYLPTSTKINQYKINNRISRLYVFMKELILIPGYWIINHNIYPNIAEHYNLGQKATTNRTEETKYTLKKELIKKANGQNLFIPLSLINNQKTEDS